MYQFYCADAEAPPGIQSTLSAARYGRDTEEEVAQHVPTGLCNANFTIHAPLLDGVDSNSSGCTARSVRTGIAGFQGDDVGNI